MSTEAPFSVTGKAGGLLVTLRGDSYEQLVANAEAVLGREAGLTFVQEVYSQALQTPMSAAVATVAKTLGPVSSVGQPLPVPGPRAAPTPESAWQAPSAPTATTAPALAIIAAAPPVEYPGDCVHGPRSYRDSMAKGRPWRRWECAVPWDRDNAASNAQRCKAVNA
jgi:hypothetical protein